MNEPNINSEPDFSVPNPDEEVNSDEVVLRPMDVEDLVYALHDHGLGHEAVNEILVDRLGVPEDLVPEDTI